MPDDTPPSVSDNDAFVALLAVAIDDAEVRRQLLALLELEAFHRHSALNTFVERMRLGGAPPDFVAAVACLTDDRIAARALEVLRDIEAGRRPSLWYSL